MALTVRIHETGGPEVLRLEDLPVQPPGVNEVLIRQRAIGVNYIDIYHRSGLYKLLGYPIGLGMEAAGSIEAVGSNVTHLKPGDRVAYCGGPVGAYGEYRTLPARYVIPLPNTITDETAAASLLKGLTAYYLLRITYKVKPGDTLLIQAAAGGVGLLLCQLAKHLGATTIGTVSTPEKATLARDNGCDHPVLYTQENWVEKTKEITGGKGVDAVYDSVGKTTFMLSLNCLKPFGMMVSFGQSSGAVAPLDPTILSQKGSLYLTRPTLMTHIEDYENYTRYTADLFDFITQKVLNVRIGGLYPLKEVKQAHIDLESRKTSGALILQA